MRAAVEAGNPISVFADETRPFLQGARLTAWELQRDGIPVTLLTDGMAGWLMARGEIACVVVGADRIAANGDVANKIGTYALAVLAAYHHLPFYVAAPWSTVDLADAGRRGDPDRGARRRRGGDASPASASRPRACRRAIPRSTSPPRRSSRQSSPSVAWCAGRSRDGLARARRQVGASAPFRARGIVRLTSAPMADIGSTRVFGHAARGA